MKSNYFAHTFILGVFFSQFYFIFYFLFDCSQLLATAKLREKYSDDLFMREYGHKGNHA